MINRCRGLLLEFGFPIARSVSAFQRGLQACLHSEELPGGVRRLLAQAETQLKQLDHQLALCEREITLSVREDEAAQRLQAVDSRVGYHKTLVAIANKNARQLWALLAKGETYDQNAWQKYAVAVEETAPIHLVSEYRVQTTAT